LFFNPAYAGDGIPHMRDEEIFLPVCDILIMAISFACDLNWLVFDEALN
jgi:hypothetical protein